MSDRNAAPSTTPVGISPLGTKLLLASIILIGVAWRCYGVSSRSLWFDEAFTCWTSRFPLPELMERVSYDNHPPLHYLLVKAWTLVFGDSPLAMRSSSVLFGALTILGTYLFVVEAMRGPDGNENGRPPPSPKAREVGLWAAALVALSVFQIRWSWDVRMYALGAALTVFTSWALFRALHVRSRPYAFWLLYALLALLFLYTHYFAMFTIAAQSLFVICRKGVRTLKGEKGPDTFLPAVLAAAVIILGWLPWLPTFLHQRGQVSAGFWVPPVDWMHTRGYGYHMMIEPECYVVAEATIVAFCCTILCVAIPLALLWKPRPVDWFTVMSALLPIGLGLLISIVFDIRIFYSRYFLFADLFILSSVALLLGRIRPPWLRATAGALLVLAMLGVDVRYLRVIDLEHSPSYRGTVAFVESQRRRDEPVVVCDLDRYLPLRYHADGAPGWYLFGSSPKPQDDDWCAMGAENVMRAQTMEAMRGGRVWVVNIHTPKDEASDKRVPVPSRWIVRSRNSFADRYGMTRDLVVVEYEAVPGAEVRQ